MTTISWKIHHVTPRNEIYSKVGQGTLIMVALIYII